MFFFLLLLIAYSVFLLLIKAPSKGDFFLLLFFILIISSVTIAPDLNNYSRDFYRADKIQSVYFGFLAVNKFFLHTGASFYDFYTLYRIMCLILVFVSVHLICERTTSCLLLYAVTSYLFNIIQMKNFALMAIMLFAFALCYRCEKSKLKYFLWISLIFIAASQHVAGFAYMPFIFFLGRRKLLEKIPIVMLFVTVFFVVANGTYLFSMLQPVLSLAVDNSYKVSKFSEKGTTYGCFIFVSLSILMIYVTNKVRVAYLFYQMYFHDSVFLGKNSRNFVENVYDLTLYSSVFWPLLVSSTLYSRLLDNLLILIIIVVISFFSMYKKLLLYVDRSLMFDLFIKVLGAFLVIMLYHIYYLWVTHWDDVIVGVLSNLDKKQLINQIF